jgi:hypothetical protein
MYEPAAVIDRALWLADQIEACGFLEHESAQHTSMTALVKLMRLSYRKAAKIRSTVTCYWMNAALRGREYRAAETRNLAALVELSRRNLLAPRHQALGT